MARIEITRGRHTQKSMATTIMIKLVRGIVKRETGQEVEEVKGYRLEADHLDLGEFRAGDVISIKQKGEA